MGFLLAYWVYRRELHRLKSLELPVRILSFEIQNLAHGIWNPSNDCKPESKFHCQGIQYLESRKSTVWNPESKTVGLD